MDRVGVEGLRQAFLDPQSRMDGTARPELDPRQLLNPRIYGQKEIFGIAQNEAARLEMIDGFAEVDLRDATGRERQMLARCEENGALISRTLRRLEEAEANLAELPNLEEWRERFRAAGFEDLLAERRQLDAEAATIRSIAESLEGHRVRRRAADRLNEALEGNVLIEIEQGIREPLVERLAAYKTKTRLEALRDLVGNKSFSPAAFAAATTAGSRGSAQARRAPRSCCS